MPWPEPSSQALNWPAKRTALMSPIGALFLQSEASGRPTFVHDEPPSIERSSSPPLPAASPICPPAWNSTSFKGTPPGGRVCLNEPSPWRVKIAPPAVVNQNRVADWYSIAVMFWVVPLGISVQMPAEAGGATAARAATAPRRARRIKGRLLGRWGSPSNRRAAAALRANSSPPVSDRRRAPC